MNSKVDPTQRLRQNLPIDRDDSRRVVVVEATPMLGPLLADQLRENQIEVTSIVDLDDAIDRPNLLAVIVAAAESWPLSEALERRSAGFAPVIALVPAGVEVKSGVLAAFARPARLDALVSVIRTLPRATASSAALEIGPLSLDVKTRRLSDSSGMERARLTEKEAEILAALLRAPSGEIGREALLRDVWRYHNAVQSHTMETHIYRLRRKLIEAEPTLAGAIETIAGGYRLRPGVQA